MSYNSHVSLLTPPTFYVYITGQSSEQRDQQAAMLAAIWWICTNEDWYI
jgi:hypothetical protein